MTMKDEASTEEYNAPMTLAFSISIITNNLQFLDSILIEALLFGDDSLSEEQNAQIFKTKRSTPQ
jgi:hypothetical protein